MLPSSLPLPVALPPPVDGKGPRQGQPEESIRAKAACSSIIRLGDKRLAISGSAEEYSGNNAEGGSSANQENSRKWWPAADIFLARPGGQPSPTAVPSPANQASDKETNGDPLFEPPGLRSATTQAVSSGIWDKGSAAPNRQEIAVAACRASAGQENGFEGAPVGAQTALAADSPLKSSAQRLTRKAAFSMILLDGDSRRELLERVPPVFGNVTAQHVFIHSKTDQKHLESLPLGCPAKLLVTDVNFGSHQTVKVKVLEPKLQFLKKPEITISSQLTPGLPPGPRPFKDQHAVSLDPPLHLQGTVCLRMHNGDTLFTMEQAPATPPKPRPAKPSLPAATPLHSRNPQIHADASTASGLAHLQQPHFKAGKQRDDSSAALLDVIDATATLGIETPAQKGVVAKTVEGGGVRQLDDPSEKLYLGRLEARNSSPQLSADQGGASEGSDAAQGSDGLEPVPFPDPEAAFWDNLLARREGKAPSQPVALVENLGAMMTGSGVRSKAAGKAGLAKGILRVPGSKAVNSGDKPLPKHRPGKHGASKLWTPGSPLTKSSQDAPLTKQPVKLLQRGGPQLTTAGEDSAKPEIRPQPLQVVVQAQPQAASLGDDLDWLEQYMEDCTLSDSSGAVTGIPEADQTPKTPKRDGSGVFDVLESPQTHSAEPKREASRLLDLPKVTRVEIPGGQDTGGLLAPEPRQLGEARDSRKGVRRAGKKMVSFMEQNPTSPSFAMTQAAEILAGQLVDQAEASGQAHPGAVAGLGSISEDDDDDDDEDEDEDDDINGDPWWTGGKLPQNLPEPSTAAEGSQVAENGVPGVDPDASEQDTLEKLDFRGRPGMGYLSDSSDDQEDTYDNLVESMMMAWTGAGGDANPTPKPPVGRQEGSVGPDTQPSHQRHVYSIPGTAFLTEPERSRAKFEARQQGRERRYRGPARERPHQEQGQPPGPQRAPEPHSLPPGECKELTAQDLAKGVKDIVAAFPHIHRHVAELTLKNYGGDIEEAIGFLKMTALTAKPSQLSQLGLIRPKESAAGRKAALAGWRKHSSMGSASNSARSTLGSGSGDEGLAAVARETRSRLASSSKPGTVQADSLLQASGPSEAIAMAMSGAEMTVAERERLRAAEEEARLKWQRHHRARQIYNEAAVQMEKKGSKESANWLRQLAYEQTQLANEYRKQCNNTAYQFSNQHVTNKIKLDLHGMSVDEGIEKLEKHITSLTGLSSSTFVIQVITGKGKHSAGGVARLAPAVKELVDSRSLEWSEEPGNPGQINVILAGQDSNP